MSGEKLFVQTGFNASVMLTFGPISQSPSQQASLTARVGF